MPPESPLDRELVAQELNTLLTFVEQHIEWARTPENDDFARLNLVTAESLIEAADLVRALCEKLAERVTD